MPSDVGTESLSAIAVGWGKRSAAHAAAVELLVATYITLAKSDSKYQTVHQKAGVNAEFLVVETAKLIQSKNTAGLRSIV